MPTTQAQWLHQVGSVLETLNQGVVISDEDRRIVFANSMFLEMSKMSAEEVLGRSVMDLYPPDDVGRLQEFIARREAQGRARYEFYIPQADGGRVPVAVTSRLVHGGDGRAYGVVTATDISDQKRAQMEQELQLAERVQQSLAPKGLTWGGGSVEAHYQPASSIGGDYGLVIPSDDRLDVETLNRGVVISDEDRRIVFANSMFLEMSKMSAEEVLGRSVMDLYPPDVVCDVSGHGISSALVANRIYSETMAQIERGAELGSMLRHLNHFAVQNLASSNFFFTVAAVRLYHARGRLQFAGAGHPPAILIHRGQSPRLLESTNMVLGLFEDAVDTESSVEAVLQRGDRVVIYTDGLTENFNSQREMLGVDGLKEILTEASTLPLDEMKSQILNRVAAWRNGPAADDVSLVLLEIS